MNYPADVKYTKSHEWIRRLEDGTCLIGLSDYAQNALGDLVYVNLPEPGDSLEAGQAFADVESVKAVSDVFSPVSGTVEEINQELMDAPETINQTPYEAWFVKVSQIEQEEELMDAQAYKAYVNSLDE